MVDSCTKWDMATSKHQKHLDYLRFISLSLSPRLFSSIRLSLCITLPSLSTPLSSSSSLLPARLKVISKAVFAGLLLLIKLLEHRPQSWLVAEAPGHRVNNGVRAELGQISECSLTLTSDFQVPAPLLGYRLANTRRTRRKQTVARGGARPSGTPYMRDGLLVNVYCSWCLVRIRAR